jgi:hypothetical protein
LFLGMLVCTSLEVHDLHSRSLMGYHKNPMMCMSTEPRLSDSCHTLGTLDPSDRNQGVEEGGEGREN